MDKEKLINCIVSEVMKANRDVYYAPPLFHGTNYNALLMTDSERKILQNACVVMQNYLLKVSDDNGCDSTHFGSSELLGEESSIIRDAAQTAYFRRSGSDRYSYGSFYLTSLPHKAFSYSCRAFIIGETGHQTKWLYEGVKRMGYFLPPKTMEEEEAFNVFQTYETKPDRPVILMFCGLSIEEIRYESGKPLNNVLHLGDGVSLRYLKEIDVKEGVRLSVDDAQLFDEIVKEMDPLLSERKLERFNSHDVRLINFEGNIVEGLCCWIPKETMHKAIQEKNLQDIIKAEEAIMVLGKVYAKSKIYKLEYADDNRFPYQSLNCLLDESKKRI